MNFTKAEAIKLILGFYTTPCGYWTDAKEGEPELIKFMSAGCAKIDEEDSRKVVPNQKGKEVLYAHFAEISDDFLDFMRNKGFICAETEAVEWFADKYNISISIGEDIFFYVANKIEEFGYSPLDIPYLRSRDGNFKLIPIRRKR